MQLPKLSSHEWRAWVALVFGILGGVALTAFAIWLVYIFAYSGLWYADTQQQRINFLGSGLILLLLGCIASLLSLGFSINQRKVSIKTPGGGEVTLEGGSPDDLQTLQSSTQTIENTGTQDQVKVQSL